MKDCATQESIKFKTKLGFNVNDIFNTNEQTVSEEITDAFKKKKISKLSMRARLLKLIFIFMTTSSQLRLINIYSL